MKTPMLLALAGVLALSAPAQTPAPQPAGGPAAPALPAAQAKLSGPFVLKDGVLAQASQTEVGDGGKAVFTFKVEAAGEYVIAAVVSAPDEDSNSFFLNIDGPPEDPLMIWDIRVTQGAAFEERVVSWRGNGDSFSDEFDPKVFKLTAGEHQIILVGREPAKLKGFTVRPAKK